jgi:hypothetical protein
MADYGSQGSRGFIVKARDEAWSSWAESRRLRRRRAGARAHPLANMCSVVDTICPAAGLVQEVELKLNLGIGSVFGCLRFLQEMCVDTDGRLVLSAEYGISKKPRLRFACFCRVTTVQVAGRQPRYRLQHVTHSQDSQRPQGASSRPCHMPVPPPISILSTFETPLSTLQIYPKPQDRTQEHQCRHL